MAYDGRISYCRAYPLRELAAFAGWSRDSSGIAPDAVGFLHEDLRVTAGPSLEDKILFNDITDDWRAFCANHLKFAVPSDITEPRRF